MSIVTNQNHRYWKDVEAQLRRKRYTFKTAILSNETSHVYADALTLWAISSYEVFSSLDSSITVDSTKRWILSIARYSVEDVAKSLRTILGQLRIEVDSSFDCDYIGFKHRCGGGAHLQKFFN